jgi:hypothetical protein
MYISILKCGPGLLFIGLGWLSVQVQFDMSALAQQSRCDVRLVQTQPVLVSELEVPFPYTRYIDFKQFKVRGECYMAFSLTILWSEVPGKFLNVVLEKDGEDKLDGPLK